MLGNIHGTYTNGDNGPRNDVDDSRHARDNYRNERYSRKDSGPDMRRGSNQDYSGSRNAPHDNQRKSYAGKSQDQRSKDYVKGPPAPNQQMGRNNDRFQSDKSPPAFKRDGGNVDREKFCQYFLTGRCRMGQKCSYVHGLSILGSAVEHQSDLVSMKLEPLTDFESTSGGYAAGTLYTGDLNSKLVRWIYNCSPNKFKLEKVADTQLRDGVSAILTHMGDVIVGYKNEGIEVFSKKTDTTFRLLESIDTQVHALLVLNGILLVGLWDANLYLYDLATRAERGRVTLPGPIKCFCPIELYVNQQSQETLLWVGSRGCISVLNLITLETLRCIWLPNPVDVCMCIYPYDGYVLCLTMHGKVYVYKAHGSGDLCGEPAVPGGSVTSACGVLRGVENKPTLILGRNDGTVSAHSLPDFELVGYTKTHHNMVRDLVVTSDDRKSFVSISMDGQVIFWEWE